MPRLPLLFSRRTSLRTATTAVPPVASAKRIGQPTHASHPHLMRPSDVTPLVSRAEIASRQQQLVDSLAAADSSTSFAVVVFAAEHLIMSNDVHYPFRQRTNFRYLVGLEEPESVAVLVPRPDARPYYHLFVRERCPAREVWDGARAGIEGARDHFACDEASPVDRVDTAIAALLAQRDIRRLYHDGASADQLAKLQSACSARHVQLQPATKAIEWIRTVKSPAEQELMRRACTATGHVFAEMMKASRTLTTENALMGFFEAGVRLHGAQRLSYPPVVASGVNAVTLHYGFADSMLDRSSLVLVDAGAEFDGYCSDITRTWPVSGRFTDAQLAVYQAVLEVNKAVIALLSEWRSHNSPLTLSAIDKWSRAQLGAHLHRLGLLPTPTSPVTRFYAHSIGHWLGMDVHDTRLIDSAQSLRPGNIITVEPGIYIPDDADIPPALRGIGIRIEDDVLITPTGAEVLTASAPKEVEDILALLAADNAARPHAVVGTRSRPSDARLE